MFLKFAERFFSSFCFDMMSQNRKSKYLGPGIRYSFVKESFLCMESWINAISSQFGVLDKKKMYSKS